MTAEAAPWSWDPDRLAIALEAAARFFEAHLEDRHREHLRARYGLTDETIARCRIGFAPADRFALVIRLMEEGLEAEEIKASGLVAVGHSGLFSLWRGRLIFPYLIGGRPTYFIGRKTDETIDTLQGKYAKQKLSILSMTGERVSNGIVEPIFGADTVRHGEPLIITEGITDCISAHQAGYPAVSPVTIRFKQEHAAALVELCRSASPIYVIMDSETSGAGLRGAVDTGLALSRAGLRPYLCEIPRPGEMEKVDLNEFIRDGGDIAGLLATAIDVDEHPIADEILRLEAGRGADRFRSETLRQRAARSTKQGVGRRRLDKAEVLAAMPPLSALIGFEGYGPHPILGSSTGNNLSVNGSQWYCFHKGNEGGGGPLEWFAVYEMRIIREGETIPREKFSEVLEAVADRFMPDGGPGGRHEPCNSHQMQPKATTADR